MHVQLSAEVIARDGMPYGRISRLIANQASRQISAAVLRLADNREVVVSTDAFSHDTQGNLVINRKASEISGLPKFDAERYYPLHPVEWQEEWGAVQGEIISLYPPVDRNRKERRRLIVAALALLGAMAAGLVYPIFRYLVHPLTKAIPRIWVRLKQRGALVEDQPLFIPYDVERVEGYLERTITKSLFLIKPSKPMAMEIAARMENMQFPDVGWANKIDDPVAFSTKCPHLGCNARWVAEEGHFICACHDSHFLLDGTVISGPAPRGLDTLPVRTDHGAIEIIDMEFRAGIPEKRRSG